MTYTEMVIVAETGQGHVSNVKLFDYLDQARKEWYHYCIMLGVEAVAVHISVNYKKEVFNDDKLSIRTELAHIGNTSYTLVQTMVTEEDVMVVFAEVVLATINRETRKKTPVPAEVRSLLEKDDLLDAGKIKLAARS